MLIHCSGLGAWTQHITFTNNRRLAQSQCKNMSILPPDDDGLGLDDAFAQLPPPLTPQPKSKAKAKAKRTPKPRAKSNNDGVKKARKTKAKEPEMDQVSGDVQPSGSSGPAKVKSEAGQDYFHRATTIPGQCLECS